MGAPSSHELAGLPLFAALAEQDREALAPYLEAMELAPDTPLVPNGRSRYGLVILRAGRATLTRAGLPSHDLEPGEAVGELSLDYPVSAGGSVVARTRVQAYGLSSARLDVLRSATVSSVLLLDWSRKMLGDDRSRDLAQTDLGQLRRAALGLQAIVARQFPRDTLHLVTYSLYARAVEADVLAQAPWSEWEYGENLQDGLRRAQALLAGRAAQPGRIVVVTNTLPSAYWEPGLGQPVFHDPPSPRTLQQTLLEAARCADAGLRIDSFLLEPSDFLLQFATDLTRASQGHVFVTGTRGLGTHLLIAYLAHKARSAG